MESKNQNSSSILNQSGLKKTNSVFSVPSSRQIPLSVRNSQILKKVEKLNAISLSVDISAYKKNPLNMIEYQMQGQRSKHDPQMILAKLRKQQNRAQLHRASYQITQFGDQKSHKKCRIKRTTASDNQKQNKISYMKIYQAYLKQKQTQTENFQRYEDEDVQIKQQEQPDQTKDGIKFYNSLKKHPKILDLTISRKKGKEGIIQKQIFTQRKSNMAQRIKQDIGVEGYQKAKLIQQQKQDKRYFQNPEKVIERQITKFYLKKNPGRLSQEAHKNQRSISLIRKQKEISLQIDENKISKDDRKKLKNRFNDLANELARSDKRNSLQIILPRLKQSQTVNSINLKQHVKQRLFAFD